MSGHVMGVYAPPPLEIERAARDVMLAPSGEEINELAD